MLSNGIDISPMPALAGRLVFHHIGIACRRVESETRLLETLGYVIDGDSFEDPQQRIRGLFMLHGTTRVELVEPTGDDSPIIPYLKRGIRMYHQCFETPCLKSILESIEADGGQLVSPPSPAVAFQGRPVAFVMPRTMMLLEFLQAEDSR